MRTRVLSHRSGVLPAVRWQPSVRASRTAA